MTMTYTVAAERDKRARAGGWNAAPAWTLAAASCLAVVAIALAYSGRFRALSRSAASTGRVRAPVAAGSQRLDSIVNLNTVRDAAELEPALVAVYAHPDDRRFAARTLFQFLTAIPASRGHCPTSARSRARP